METTDIVIIGGGVLGGAVAFYLAKQNPGRIVLLERHAVAQGNSSLAAGLLTRGRFKPALIPMVLETYRAIEELETNTGENLGMHQTGCLYAAVSPAHQKELHDLADISKQAGLRVEWLDRAAAAELLPWLKLPRDSSLIFMPDDGYIDGYTIASKYLQAARKAGVEVLEQTTVLGIQRAGERVTGLKTNQADIAAGLVIDAAGVWAQMLANEIGISLPMAPVRSHYWLTEAHPAFSARQPFVILPDARAYARPENKRLLFGLRETQSVVVNPRELPESMNAYTFKQDPQGWDALLEGIPEFSKFLPLIEGVEISSYVKGFSNYSPDGNFALGAFPGVEGFLAATGCSGAGIAMSGGIGRFIAELATGRAPFVDGSPHRLDRFGAIDPLSAEFLQRCAAARSGKITG